MITGASAGIGKATALDLLARGFVVYGLARRVAKMQALVEAGGHALELDVTKPDAAERCVQRIVAEQGRIDVLVNNAGFGLYGPVEEVPLDQARYQYDVNLFGVARLTQLVLPYMRRARRGRIINISSMGGVITLPLGAWYHSTKFALEGWSDCLRQEVRAFGIDVVVVRPGIIATEFEAVATERYATGEDSAYGPLSARVREATRTAYASRRATDARVVARTIARAAQSTRPRTRYHVGHLATTLVRVRQLLPDRWWDAAVLRQGK